MRWSALVLQQLFSIQHAVLRQSICRQGILCFLINLLIALSNVNRAFWSWCVAHVSMAHSVSLHYADLAKALSNPRKWVSRAGDLRDMEGRNFPHSRNRDYIVSLQGRSDRHDKYARSQASTRSWIPYCSVAMVTDLIAGILTMVQLIFRWWWKRSLKMLQRLNDLLSSWHTLVQQPCRLAPKVQIKPLNMRLLLHQKSVTPRF